MHGRRCDHGEDVGVLLTFIYVLRRYDHASVLVADIDLLVAGIGWLPLHEEERVRMRRRVREIVCVLATLTVNGSPLICPIQLGDEHPDARAFTRGQSLA